MFRTMTTPDYSLWHAVADSTRRRRPLRNLSNRAEDDHTRVAIQMHTCIS
jgi:hypothetical protein